MFPEKMPRHSGKGSIPRVLTLLSERVRGYYYQPGRVLPSLNFANGSQRQMRSERRDACLLLLGAIIRHVDLVSLRVGFPTKEGFLSLTLPYLARQSGMPQRRAERALRDLKAANLITVSQPRQLMDDGTWRGLSAVKAVSKHLFAAFGLQTALKWARGHATKRLKKKAEGWQSGRQNLTHLARLRLFLGGTTPAKRPGGLSASPGQRKLAGEMSFEERRRYNIRCAELMQAHPDWTEEQVREAAQKAV